MRIAFVILFQRFLGISHFVDSFKAETLETNVANGFTAINDVSWRRLRWNCGIFKIDAWIPRLLFGTVVPEPDGNYIIPFFPWNEVLMMRFQLSINMSVIVIYVVLWVIPELIQKQTFEMMGGRIY